MTGDTVSGIAEPARLSSMSARRFKNEVGDWVAVPLPGAEGMARPAKVIEASGDGIIVRLRFEDGEREMRFNDPLPRVRWRKVRGRSAWYVA